MYTYNVDTFTAELSASDNSVQLAHKIIHVITTSSTCRGDKPAFVRLNTTLQHSAQYHFKY